MQSEIQTVHGISSIGGQTGREPRRNPRSEGLYKADMEKRLRKTTMKQKEYVMKDKVLPYFGNMPINAITAPMIRKWQGEMIDKGFKPTLLMVWVEM